MDWHAEVFRRPAAPESDPNRRQADQQWLLRECSELDGTLRLLSIDCDLALAEVYDKVELLEG